MLRKGRTREQASAQFAGEWEEGGVGNAFSTANRRFAPLKMPFLPYSGGPTQSGGLKGRGQCEALHSPETPGTLSAWPVRRRMSPKMIENERAAALSNSPWDFSTVRIAIYGDFSRYTSKPLKDFIRESNRGRDVFFAATKDEAVDLLTR